MTTLGAGNYPNWQGPNKNYLLLQNEGNVKAYPHLPIPAHLQQMIAPTEKTIDGKGGVKEPIYDFEDWVELCPEEAAFSTVARVLGEDAMAAVTSQDVEQAPGTDLLRGIAARLITIGAYKTRTNPKTGWLKPPQFATIKSLNDDARASGDPISFLDTYITQIQTPKD